MSQSTEREVVEVEVAPTPSDDAESASPASTDEPPTTSEQPNRLKRDALRRLKALERRGKTVGTHLDELRALMTLLFEQLPD